MKGQLNPADMDQAAFDAAAGVAALERDPMARYALPRLRVWWLAHYQKAGHRRLARVLLGTFKKGSP